MNDVARLAIVSLAGVAAGGVNAIAGGGGLIAFPVMLAFGVPPVSASASSTVVMVPGFLGSAGAQRRDLKRLVSWCRPLFVAGMVGGAVGAAVLATTSNGSFESLVPFMLIGACALILGQDRIRGWLTGRRRQQSVNRAVILGLTVAASVYGGFFGAGLGIVMLAILGIGLTEPPKDLNVMKTAVSLGVNIAAGVFVIAVGLVDWPITISMAIGSTIGGYIGGRFVGKLKPQPLRRLVCVIAVVLTAVYLLR